MAAYSRSRSPSAVVSPATAAPPSATTRSRNSITKLLSSISSFPFIECSKPILLTPLRTVDSTAPSISLTRAEVAAPGSSRSVAFERVGSDPPGHVLLADRYGAGAVRLAPRLFLEVRQHLRAETQPGIAGEHLRPHVRRELLRPPSDHLPTGGDLQQVGLGVSSGGYVAHVQHDDLRGPGGPLLGPACSHTEGPGQLPSRDLGSGRMADHADQ